MLKTSRNRGETLVIGFGDELMKITITSVGERRVEFTIEAPASVRIYKNHEASNDEEAVKVPT